MPIANNYFKIGLFAIVGTLLLVAGLLAFGLSDALFKKRLVCVTFFERSVQGLSADSAVKFRGFRVGKVTSISLASPNKSTGLQPAVKVIFEIEPAALAGQDEDAELARTYISGQIDRGLKVILSIQGVTGIGFLDLDYTEDPKGKYYKTAYDWAQGQDLVYIPSGPSQIMEISESASRIVKSLSDVDFADISNEAKALIKNLNKAVTDLDTAALSGDVNDTLSEIRLAAGELVTLLRDADETIKGGAKTNLGRELEATVQQVRQSLKRLDQLFGSSQSNLPVTLDNLRVMSENFRELSELLKDQPSQALFGQPPRPSEPAAGANRQTD